MAKRSRGSHRLTVPEARFLLGALADVPRNGVFSRSWAMRRVVAFGRSAGVEKGTVTGWGWKEPSTHLILEEVLDHFERSVYIHVVRHGLDMCFSSNLNQLRRFGPLFGVPVSYHEPLAVSALRYWIRANRRALDIMGRHPPERTLVVRFDELCRSPDAEVRRLLRFLCLEPEQTSLRELLSLPKAPASSGRYQDHHLTIFADNEIEAVRQLGFEVQR
ncbi:MAG: sulfotransferase [Acidimicrobiales bacterium]